MPDPARRLVVVLLALTIAVGGAACSKKEKAARPRLTPTTAAPGAINLTVVPAPNTPAAVKDATQALLQRYLDDAILAPLRSGGPAPDLGGLFTAETAPRVTTGDRAALVGEGMPSARGGVEADAASATLTPLVVGGGQVPLVVAEIDLRLRARDVEGSGVTVAQHGELLLVPEGTGWRIGGYDMLTTRDTPAGTTTTTAVKR